MYKRILAMILVIAMVLLSGVTMTEAGTSIRVKVAGKDVKFTDQKPVVEKGTTLVPIRFVAQNLGFTVAWNGAAQQATISDKGTKIVLTIGSDVAQVNGEDKKLTTKVKTIGGRTMVPLRFISENLNCTVDWFKKNNIAAINKKVNGRDIRMVDRFMQSEEYTKQDTGAGIVLTPKDTELYYIIREGRLSDIDGKKYLISDGHIEVSKPYAKTRAAVKEAIGIMSPAHKEMIYMYFIVCARGEVYEGSGHGDLYPTVHDYLDGRNIHVSNNGIYFIMEGKRFPPFRNLVLADSKLGEPVNGSSWGGAIEEYGLTEYTTKDYKRMREPAFWEYFLQYFEENVEYYKVRGVRCYDPRKDTNAEEEYRDALASYPVVSD